MRTKMTRPIKAVRIDPAARLISFVTLAVEPTGWEGPITAELACSDVVRIGIDQQRSVWFDDAAFHRPWAQQSFFAIDGNTLAGTALVINHDSDGVPCNVGITLKAVRARLTWIDPQDVRIDAPSFTYEKGGKIVTEYLGGQPFFTFDHQPGGEPASSTTPSDDQVKGLALIEAAHDGGGQHDFSLLPNEGSLDSVHVLNHGDPKQWPGVKAAKRSNISEDGKSTDHVHGFFLKSPGRPVQLPDGLTGELAEQRALVSHNKQLSAATYALHPNKKTGKARDASKPINNQRGVDSKEAVKQVALPIVDPKLQNIKQVLHRLQEQGVNLKQSIVGRYLKELEDAGEIWT